MTVAHHSPPRPSVLIISFYYEPDLSAGSFRATALAKVLARTADVEVLTTLPQRYASHVVSADPTELQDGIKITRFDVPAHTGSMLTQIKTFMIFATLVLRAAYGRQPDIIFATSSRLGTGFLGAIVSLLKRRPLFLDIRDIFVDTLKSVMSRRSFALINPMVSMIERFVISRAARVNFVSKGFEGYFSARYARRDWQFVTNGIDDEFILQDAEEPKAPRQADRMNIVYAGNIGEGQGLHTVVPAAAAILGDEVIFTVIGDGGKRAELEAAVAALDVRNVVLRPPIGRSQLSAIYAGADVLLIHLNAYDAFLKVLPSKVFECGASGRPVIAGVAGYAAEFLAHELADVRVFAPGDVVGMVEAIRAVARTAHMPDRQAFVEKYRRTTISETLAANILGVVESASSVTADTRFTMRAQRDSQ